jgi:hypothetical protein
MDAVQDADQEDGSGWRFRLEIQAGDSNSGSKPREPSQQFHISGPERNKLPFTARPSVQNAILWRIQDRLLKARSFFC